MGQNNIKFNNILSNEVADYLDLKKNILGKSFMKVLKEKYSQKKIIEKRSFIQNKFYSEKKYDKYSRLKSANTIVTLLLSKANVKNGPNPSLFNTALTQSLVKIPNVSRFLRIGFIENTEIFNNEYNDFTSLCKENKFYSNQIAYLTKIKLISNDQYDLMNLSKLDASFIKLNTSTISNLSNKDKKSPISTKSPKNLLTEETKENKLIQEKEGKSNLQLEEKNETCQIDFSNKLKSYEKKDKGISDNSLILVNESNYKKQLLNKTRSNLSQASINNSQFNRGRNIQSKHFSTNNKSMDVIKNKSKTPDNKKIRNKPIINVKIKLVDLKKEQVYAEKNAENKFNLMNKSKQNISNEENNDISNDYINESHNTLNETNNKHAKSHLINLNDNSAEVINNQNKTYLHKKAIIGKYKVINKDIKEDSSFIEIVNKLTKQDLSKSPNHNYNTSLKRDISNDNITNRSILSKRLNTILNKKKVVKQKEVNEGLDANDFYNNFYQ